MKIKRCRLRSNYLSQSASLIENAHSFDQSDGAFYLVQVSAICWQINFIEFQEVRVMSAQCYDFAAILAEQLYV